MHKIKLNITIIIFKNITNIFHILISSVLYDLIFPFIYFQFLYIYVFVSKTGFIKIRRKFSPI